jgi:hypothetical protein
MRFVKHVSIPGRNSGVCHIVRNSLMYPTVRGVPFIVSLIAAALLRKRPASAGHIHRQFIGEFAVR